MSAKGKRGCELPPIRRLTNQNAASRWAHTGCPVSCPPWIILLLSSYGWLAIGTPHVAFDVVLDTSVSQPISVHIFTSCAPVPLTQWSMDRRHQLYIRLFRFEASSSSTLKNLSQPFEIQYGSEKQPDTSCRTSSSCLDSPWATRSLHRWTRSRRGYWWARCLGYWAWLGRRWRAVEGIWWCLSSWPGAYAYLHCGVHTISLRIFPDRHLERAAGNLSDVFPSRNAKSAHLHKEIWCNSMWHRKSRLGALAGPWALRTSS